jgi:hypothetical protein
MDLLLVNLIVMKTDDIFSIYLYHIWDVHADIQVYTMMYYLELTVLRNVTVSTNHVIQLLVHVLLVDVNVDIKRIPVVQVCDADDHLTSSN